MHTNMSTHLTKIKLGFFLSNYYRIFERVCDSAVRHRYSKNHRCMVQHLDPPIWCIRFGDTARDTSIISEGCPETRIFAQHGYRAIRPVSHSLG